jgi:hypothetical protein
MVALVGLMLHYEYAINMWFFVAAIDFHKVGLILFYIAYLQHLERGRIISKALLRLTEPELRRREKRLRTKSPTSEEETKAE